MSRFEKVIKRIKTRRERAVTGKYNCLPLPFPRFRRYFPGTEKGRYMLITANQKVGKSKLCDDWFIYEPLFFIMEHPELKMKVTYFTLEVTAEEKYAEFLCHLLYKLDNLIVDTTMLMSTNNENPIDPAIIELLESERYRPYREAYEEMVTYIDDVKNPTGIYKICKQYAEEHGHWTTKIGKRKDEFGDIVDGEVRDDYIADDEEEYRVIILDNASNIETESGLDKRESIDRMSKYFIDLRNNYDYICVLIQHQAQAQEGNDNIKLNRTYPTADGLADCKTTIRDINTSVGLFNPRKHNIPMWENYEIPKFGDHIRFLIVMDDRDYGAGGKICPLFFNGASSYFAELPPPTDREGLERVYRYIRSLDSLPGQYDRVNLSLVSFSKNMFNKVADSIKKSYLCSRFFHN